MSYRRNYRSSAPRVARWMDLHYAGTCAQCGVTIPAGGRGFYDPADRSVCCIEIECAKAHGVTREVWHGSPVSGGYVTELSAYRIGGSRDLVRDPGEDAADRWGESQ